MSKGKMRAERNNNFLAIGVSRWWNVRLNIAKLGLAD